MFVAVIQGHDFLDIVLSGESLASVGANILMLAVGTELVQFFIEGRTPLVVDFLIDFLIDFSGGLVGLVMGCRLAQMNADLKPNKTVS